MIQPLFLRLFAAVSDRVPGCTVQSA